jgi:hypothetical protein
MTAETLITETRAGFALAGLCSMHKTELTNPIGEIEPVVVVAPAFGASGIAIRYMSLKTDDRIEILEGAVQHAEEAGII